MSNAKHDPRVVEALRDIGKAWGIFTAEAFRTKPHDIIAGHLLCTVLDIRAPRSVADSDMRCALALLDAIEGARTQRATLGIHEDKTTGTWSAWIVVEVHARGGPVRYMATDEDCLVLRDDLDAHNLPAPFDASTKVDATPAKVLEVLNDATGLVRLVLDALRESTQ